MRDERKSHEALLCTHCGEKNRMYVLAFDIEKEIYDQEPGPSYEIGTRYEVQRCPRCNKVVLVGGGWHEGMEEPDDWSPSVLLPESRDREARKHLAELELDMECMNLAVAQARLSTPEGTEPKPLVGAVVAQHGGVVASAYRGELKSGDHAEFTLLEGKCKDHKLAGSTVYTTLEPCTTRNPPKVPCVERLVARKVSRVVIGMLDPDERIRGRGILALRKANIRVDLFPPTLMTELEELNREFITERERVRSVEPIGNMPPAG